MKSSKRHVVLLSLIFLLKCFSKSFFIRTFYLAFGAIVLHFVRELIIRSGMNEFDVSDKVNNWTGSLNYCNIDYNRTI